MPVLIAENLWKSFSGRTVVSGLTFSIERGEILGILGPNGAGKSTTVGMLYGLIRPDRGTVTVCSRDVLRYGREARALLGVVQQENNLERDFTVRESLLNFSHHFSLWGKVAAERVQEVVEKVGLESYQNAPTETLSGGYQRRVVLARALLNRPQLVFLDEPTTGLDPEARQDFWRLVSRLRSEGKAVLLTTHYMDEAERLCDRLLLLREGARIDEGSPQDLIQRIIGSEVVESEGIEEGKLEELLKRFALWKRPLGDGVVMNLPNECHEKEKLWEILSQSAPRRITRRKADLQDVFLFLTGVRLGE